MGSIVIIIILCVLLILSGFFSSSETAFSSVNLIRLKQYSKSSKKRVSQRAKKVLKTQNNYAIFLSTVLVGNNIVNITCSSLATYLFASVYNMGESGVLIATIVISIMVIIFGEIIPKTLARIWPEKFAMFSIVIIDALIFVFKPITLLFGKFDEKVSDLVEEEEKVTATENELIDIVEKIEKEGVLEHQESELIQSAITFDSKSVRSIMTPRENVKFINVDDDFETVSTFFDYNQYTRVPVYDKENDRIVGIIHQRDVYSCYFKNEKKNAKELMGDAVYVSHRRLIPYALEQVQKYKSHLAIVVDNVKDKNFLGIISLEDILEELVGEIYDEYDDSPTMVFEIGNHIYQVNGKVTVDQLFDEYLIESDFPKTKAKNVGEWISEMIGDEVGEVELYYDNLKITVLEWIDKNVELVEIEVLTNYNEE